MNRKKYPKDYKGPKAGESSDEEWLSVRWYEAYINILNATWTYCDFDCFCAALERSGEKRALDASKQFQEITNTKNKI
jgi:hypothetical protein